ncbi:MULTISPECIES: hypothetical protein [Enterococcus]|uniref:hypothetical protein n=1 Tax=Enterococcus TaxID=1350 RepID=UPI00032F4C60|nr:MULTISPECIES: hypothetical protein [Enterococcus]MDQ8288449.1 hypothetical protein [Enterococcus faecium]EGO2738435.1 hypothetical protein [Enterococcus faecalis]EGO8990899.1 hypothetical protein [Enterococcus faecalis]EIW9708028.1 hypothetical protein [Enterococcus faecalis]EIX2433303.1 hypothetical protein [Enterococcus faecalis]
MNYDIKLLIVGAVISLLSTMIGFLGQTFIQYLISNKGKVKIYIKKVYSKVNSQPYGFIKDDTDTIFSVPIWIEFHNTKEKRAIVRNLNLQIYNKGKYISNMVQASHIKETAYANNGAYSFILEPLSISKFDLQFLLKKSEIKEDFDEVRISYYDFKDKYHEKTILSIDNPWENKTYSIDKDWVLIN